MAIITLSSQKGGVGKTTIALVLGQVLAHQHHKVCILEYGKAGSLHSWAKRARGQDCGSFLEVISDIKNETDLIEKLYYYNKVSEFTIIDCPRYIEGSLWGLAQLSDIVLIPLEESDLSLAPMQRLIDGFMRQESLSKQKINYRCIFSNVRTIKSKEARKVEEIIKVAGIPLIRESVPHKTAFSVMFQCARSLYEVDEYVGDPVEIRMIAEIVTKAVISEIMPAAHS